MSFPTVPIHPWNINTKSIIPLYYPSWKGKPLFIVKGEIKGASFPKVHGTAYLYEEYSWPKGKKVSREECIRMAVENNRDKYIDVTDDLFDQLFNLRSEKSC